MFCSRCGKKVLDTMLFCPFCGAKIIIPDQAGDAADGGDQPTVLLRDDDMRPAEREFFRWDTEDKPELKDETAEPTWEQGRPQSSPDNTQILTDKTTMVRSETDSGREYKGGSAFSTVQEGESKLDFDVFLEGNDHSDDKDEFDVFEETQRRRSRKSDRYRDDDDDDELEEGFFGRHSGVIIALVVLLVLAIGALIFLLTDPGQRLLGQMDMTLPLKPEVYSQLGFESYEAKEYKQAGLYYERALARSPDNYNFASSAAMAYLADNDNQKATEMLKRCIEIRPGATEPYLYLLTLYPDARSRSAEITRLLEQGYQNTGDERLKAQ